MCDRMEQNRLHDLPTLTTSVNDGTSPQDGSKENSILGSFLDLPDELLFMILSYATLPDLALRVWPLRNRRIRLLCQDATFCKSITVDAQWDEDTARAVVSMVGRRLEELTVTAKAKSDYYFNFQEAVASKTFSNRGHLRDSEATGAVLSTLLSAIGKSATKVTLRKLSLKTKSLWSLQEQNVACSLSSTLLDNASSSLRNLTCLDLQDSQFRNDAWVKAIADNCTYLEHVALPSMFVLTDGPFKYLLERVWKRLKYLALTSFLLTEDAYHDLRHCQHLEQLMVSRASRVGQEVLKTILELPELRQFYISHATKLTGDDFVQALHGRILPKMVCLEMRDMEASIDDETLDAISTSCPNLVGLILYRGCRGFGEAGIRKVLDRCKNISMFYMYDLGSETPPSFKDFNCDHNSSSKTKFCMYRSKVSDSIRTVVLLGCSKQVWQCMAKTI